MQDGRELIDSLKREHARLSRLLAVIDSGRWWTTDAPGRPAMAGLAEQVAVLRGAVDEIDRVVGQIGTSGAAPRVV